MTSLLAARSTGRGMRLVDSAEELHHHGTVAAKPRVMARAACSRRSRHLVQASDAEGRDPANSVPLEASACAPATTAVDDSPAAAGQHPSGDAAGAAAAQRWDTLTQQLVALSTLPFIFLFLPQLLKNHANLTAGNAEALAVLSWMGFLTGLGGNSLLLSYFAAKREMNAVVVQATGIASSFAVLTQVRGRTKLVKRRRPEQNCVPISLVSPPRTTAHAAPTNALVPRCLAGCRSVWRG